MSAVDEWEGRELSGRESPGTFSLLVDVCVGEVEADAEVEGSSDGREEAFSESGSSKKGFRFTATGWLIVSFGCVDFDVGLKEVLLKAFATIALRAFDGEEGSALMARRLFEVGAGDGTERDLFLGETDGGAKAAVKEGFDLAGDLVICGPGDGLVIAPPDLGNDCGADGVV